MRHLIPAVIAAVAAIAVGAGAAGCAGTPAGDADHPTLQELRRQAGQGDAAARFALGMRYAAGDGVPRDNVLAWMWFSLAAERPGAEAGYEARRMQERLDPDMFRHQIAEAERLARIWLAQQRQAAGAP